MRASARLHGRGQIHDVLQEQRAAARRGDLAAARHPLEIRRRGLRRRAEEQAVEARGIARRAGDANERRRGTARAVVQLARHRFHVGAAIGDEQDAAVDLRRAADQFLDADDRHRAAYELEGNG